MKASDYLVEYLISNGITDVFGYPGGMVTHLMDSLSKYQNKIKAHLLYHEQGVSFAACGYAQTSGKMGVAYATSGPGATNLITGICNAYFDSIPTLFITGQVNSNESKKEYGIRQRGFQETDIVSIVKPVTKYAEYVETPDILPNCLEKAFDIANSGRKGPVLLDIPMNVFRSDIGINCNNGKNEFIKKENNNNCKIIETLTNEIEKSKRPCILIGNGIKAENKEKDLRILINKLKVPVVSSMISFDALFGEKFFYGFIGAYGQRTGNFILAKSDLVISIGSRLDIRQVGVNRDNFAPKAKLIRFDIDLKELQHRIHDNDVKLCVDINTALFCLNKISLKKDFSSWIHVCDEIKDLVSDVDKDEITTIMKRISESTPEGTVITTDVGQNQVWVAQSFDIKKDQKVLFSGGHGAMGYSLPASIGACYAVNRKPVLCIAGDGGMQMNIQELQTVARDKLPIKIIVLNNNALGMIRHFQEMYFSSRYYQTKPEGGYTAPSFSDVAKAYGIKSRCISAESIEEIDDLFFDNDPELVEVIINKNTYTTPKLEFGKPNQDQEPLLERNLYDYIMNL